MTKLLILFMPFLAAPAFAKGVPDPCVQKCMEGVCTETECKEVCRLERDCFLGCMADFSDCDACIEVCEADC